MINLFSSSLIVVVLSLFTPQHATYFITLTDRHVLCLADAKEFCLLSRS
jgi:hypothetical protein